MYHVLSMLKSIQRQTNQIEAQIKTTVSQIDIILAPIKHIQSETNPYATLIQHIYFYLEP